MDGNQENNTGATVNNQENAHMPSPNSGENGVSEFPQIRKENPFAPIPDVVPAPEPFERQPAPPAPQIEKEAKETRTIDEFMRLWDEGESISNIDILEKGGLLEKVRTLPSDQVITVVMGWASERAYRTLGLQKDMPAENNADKARIFIRLQRSYAENVMGLIKTLNLKN